MKEEYQSKAADRSTEFWINFQGKELTDYEKFEAGYLDAIEQEGVKELKEELHQTHIRLATKKLTCQNELKVKDQQISKLREALEHASRYINVCKQNGKISIGMVTLNKKVEQALNQTQ